MCGTCAGMCTHTRRTHVWVHTDGNLIMFHRQSVHDIETRDNRLFAEFFCFNISLARPSIRLGSIVMGGTSDHREVRRNVTSQGL